MKPRIVFTIAFFPIGLLVLLVHWLRRPEVGLTLLYGLVAGLILSALRAPTGLDLTQVAVADATIASIFRRLR